MLGPGPSILPRFFSDRPPTDPRVQLITFLGPSDQICSMGVKFEWNWNPGFFDIWSHFLSIWMNFFSVPSGFRCYLLLHMYIVGVYDHFFPDIDYCNADLLKNGEHFIRLVELGFTNCLMFQLGQILWFAVKITRWRNWEGGMAIYISGSSPVPSLSAKIYVIDRSLCSLLMIL
jgi:hypothetical protein